jgi:hypothetical protein
MNQKNVREHFMRKTAFGIGKGLDGREAARAAVQQAFSKLGTARPALAIAFIAQEYNISEALAGLNSFLGNTPLWGFSTIAPLTQNGEEPGSIVVAILSGSELKARTLFVASEELASGPDLDDFYQLASALDLHGLILAGDGVNHNLPLVFPSLAKVTAPIAGCLASGDYASGRTVQFAENKSAPGALAAVALGGRFRMGIASGHGWQDVGLLLQVTQVKDVWNKTLDNLPAAEAYARFFGYPARQWAFPPLKDLARLYALGIEIFPGSTDLILRSPLHIEVDGGFRMNAPIIDDQVAHLMLGDPNACVEATRDAAVKALRALGNAAPMMALVLVDQSWNLLFKAKPLDWLAALHSVLGDIPILGAYTLGQIQRPSPDTLPQIYNQNLEIILIGQAEG